MSVDDEPEVEDWELKMVVASAPYLDSLQRSERDAMRQLEVFLKEFPPSAPIADVPDDILG